MKRLIICCFILVKTNLGFAQFTDSTQHYFRFSSTGIINKTDETNSYVLSNALNFNAKKKKLTYNTAFSWIYGSQQNNLTNNDFSGHGDIDYNKGLKKLYYWGLVNYDKSYSLKINYRLQTGVGLAYTIIDSPYLKINISDGILYEKGDLNDDIIGRDVYQIPRNSFRLSYRWEIANRLHIDGVQFYQPSLIALDDYIIQSTNNVSIKLKQWLSITGSIIYNKVSRTNRDNLLITYGLTIEKYF